MILFLFLVSGTGANFMILFLFLIFGTGGVPSLLSYSESLTVLRSHPSNMMVQEAFRILNEFYLLMSKTHIWNGLTVE